MTEPTKRTDAMNYTDIQVELRKQYASLDDQILFELDGILDQCDKMQYYNAIHRCMRLQQIILQRQQHIHRVHANPDYERPCHISAAFDQMLRRAIP